MKKSKPNQINLDLTYSRNHKNLKAMTKEQWEEIHPALSQTNCGTKKHRFLLTVASPYLTINQKSVIVDKLNIRTSDVQKIEDNLLFTVFNTEALNFLTIKYPKLDILKICDVKKFHYRHSQSILSINEIVSYLIKHHPLYGPNLFPHKQLTKFMLLGVDFKGFIPQQKIEKVVNEQMESILSFDSYRPAVQLLYQAYQSECNKFLYSKKPQLELFANLIISSDGSFHNNPLDYIKNLAPMNLKPWAKKEFGFNSANLLNYIKDSHYLDTGIYLMSDITLLNPILQDHNLLWQVLPKETPKHTKYLISYHLKNYNYNDINRTLNNLKNDLSPEQWTILFKEVYVNLNTTAVKDNSYHPAISTLVDTLKMIRQSQQGENNLLMKALKENYRFNDYNTWKKFHDVCSLLYTKLKNPEKSLHMDIMYPGLSNCHNAKISESLSVFIPQTNLDMIQWGQKLRICVGSYWQEVAQGRTLVLGLYEEAQIKYCLEYSISANSVRQLKGYGNYNASVEVLNQTKDWLTKNQPLWDQIKISQQTAKKDLVKKDYKEFRDFIDENLKYPTFEEEFKPVWDRIEYLLNKSNDLNSDEFHLLGKVEHFLERVDEFLGRFSNRDYMDEHMFMRGGGLLYSGRRSALLKGTKLSYQQEFILELCEYLRDLVIRFG